MGKWKENGIQMSILNLRKRIGGRKRRSKIALLLAVAVLASTNLVTYAEEGTEAYSGEPIVDGSEIGAYMNRWMEAKDTVLAVKGETKRITAGRSYQFDTEKYEWFNDGDHPYTTRLNMVQGEYVLLTGNTSQDTKIVEDKTVTKNGFFESFNVQIGEDEEAEEITVTVYPGFWGYYLRNKETGELIRATGMDHEPVSVTLKVVEEKAEFALERKMQLEKQSVNPGEEMKVEMDFHMNYDEEKYELYNDREHSWYLGIENCTVSGNTCERTRVENKYDYANTRHLIVDEEEKAKELTVTMECGNWSYWVRNKETMELLAVRGNNKETFQAVIKVGGDYGDNGGAPESSQDGAPESGNTESESNAPEEPLGNEVTGAGGVKIVSTVPGIYQAAGVAGVAIMTPKEQVETAAGIGIEKTGNVRFYICDNRKQEEKNALEQAAVLNGKKMLTAVNVDLYIISKEGVVSKVGNTASKVRLVMGIPDRYQGTDKSFSIGIKGTDGMFYVLEDLDSNPATITIETDKFGTMALME